ncbi:GLYCOSYLTRANSFERASE FAMILY 92 PROTEIN [Salix koriyanagi]|uniref:GLYCOSYLTRANSFERASE FAMILY 92 PROTEIN n=1 Tax=Salix koriyanagi TaxID=2511006 RepID=A0A9Q0Q8W1_9ROSI|nr:GLYCOSYLTRANSFERASE FAMILY 92 PROTEIN [Salix koriyanagi]
MGKERSEKERGGGEQNRKNLFVSCVVMNSCAAELKLLLTVLLVICSVATLFQTLPSRFTISASDLRFCITRISTATSNSTSTSASASIASLNSTPTMPPSPSPPSTQKDQVADNGVIKRVFNPYGSAAYNFITMGAYRGGRNTFAVIGSASKPLHVYSETHLPM